MDWITSTHLADLSTLEPAAAMLGLVVWTKSGGAPYQEQSPRYPVRLGSRAAIAQDLGMSAATIKRHWASFESAFVQTACGGWTPALSHWRDPAEHGPKDSAGRPLYVRIHPQAVAALTSLCRHAPARTAWAAFRIAIRVLPRLRSAAHRGSASVVWTNDQIASQLGMGRSTLTAALALLERRGLIQIGGKRYRRISATRGLLAAIPSVRESGYSQPYPHPVEKPQEVITTGPQGGSQQDRSSYEVEQDRSVEQASRAGARDGDCDSQEVIQVLMDALPGLAPEAARELARFCRSPLDALEWVYQESNVMGQSRAANPVGIFIYLARSGASRPGVPSSWSKKLIRKGVRPLRRPLTLEEQAQKQADKEAHDRWAASVREAEEEEERRRSAAREARTLKAVQSAESAQSLDELRSASKVLAALGKRAVTDAWEPNARAAFVAKLESAERAEKERQHINNREQAAQLLARLMEA